MNIITIAADTGLPAQFHVVHIVLALDVGGLERNVVNQVREGHRLGQRVSVVCLERPGTLAAEVAARGAKVVVLDKRPGLRPSCIVRMRRALAELRPDVVHTHQLATLLYGGSAARSLGVPVVVHTEHGRERYRSRLRTRLLGRVAGTFCDRFYCLSSDMAREVRAFGVVGAHKVREIRNGIDLSQFTGRRADRAAVRRSLSIPKDARLIGTVGRLTEIKRQDLLIRAFAQVRRQIPDVHLLLVGDGPLLGELQSLATELGVADGVRFAGYRPHSGPYLQAMDLFALTSRSEGMPQAVLEACVTGLPVVATRVGGLPELIEPGVTGLLVEPNDPGELAAALLQLLDDPEACRRMGAAARERVEARFDVRRMAANYHADAVRLLREKRCEIPATLQEAR